MPKPLTATIPYNTLLRYMLAHQADIAIAMKPSNYTDKQRLLLLRESHTILRAELARWGIDLLTDAQEVPQPPASPLVTDK